MTLFCDGNLVLTPFSIQQGLGERPPPQKNQNPPILNKRPLTLSNELGGQNKIATENESYPWKKKNTIKITIIPSF